MPSIITMMQHRLVWKLCDGSELRLSFQRWGSEMVMVVIAVTIMTMKMRIGDGHHVYT